MTRDEFQKLASAARDPWRFLTEFVQTQDPERGVLDYPSYPYLRKLIRKAMSRRLLLVPKSRQMLVTWTMVSFFLWRALFEKPGIYLYLSRNERCAEELIERTRFVLKRLPQFIQPSLSTNSRSELGFAGLGSRILSLPATSDGPRMYSPTGVFWDEMAFTPYDEQIWTALKPALDSGGSFVGVSSSGGPANYFARSVKSNGSRVFTIHRVHYSDHPLKKKRWQRKAREGLSARQWEREQEISFESSSDLVYSEFDPVRHILTSDLKADPEADIFRSIDFGYRYPFVLWLQRFANGEMVVFDEWAGRDSTTEQMLQAIRKIDLMHGLTEADVCWTACDPAGAAAQDAGLSPVDQLAQEGVKLRYRSSRILPGIERVKTALCDAAGRVRLRVSPRCRTLITDFSRYRWAERGEVPLKDGQSDHSMDALRYFFVNLDSENELYAQPRLTGWRLSA